MKCFFKVMAVMAGLGGSAASLQASDLDGYDGDRINHQRWLKTYKDFDQWEVTSPRAVQVTENLKSNEKPSALPGCVYIQDGTRVRLKKNEDSPQRNMAIRVYGPKGCKVNYVAHVEEDTWHETFAPTRLKSNTYKGGRNYKEVFNPFKKKIKGVTLSFDRGHGIDHADTLLANGMNSSHDKLNFVPQNHYYNYVIRNHLVAAIRKARGRYKELAVYDEDSPVHTYSKGRGRNRKKHQIRIPIGFILMTFFDRKVGKTYYFPNLINYKSLPEAKKTKESFYVKFCRRFEINPQGAFDIQPVQKGDVDGHRRVVFNHAQMGYRSLSGRFNTALKVELPRSAKAALMRMLTIYHMEKTAEKEFKGIEHKATLVRTYTNKMRYLAFDAADPKEQKTRQQKINALYKELSHWVSEKTGEKGFSLLDYQMQKSLYDYSDALWATIYPADDPRERALQEFEDKFEAYKAGRSLYAPEKAKQWMVRLEKAVARYSTVEDKLELLCLYDIPEVLNDVKRKKLENLLEHQGKEHSTLDEKQQVADYFYQRFKDPQAQDTKEHLGYLLASRHWMLKMEGQLEHSKDVEDILLAADWYHAGYGVVPQNIDRSRALYRRAVPLIGTNPCQKSEKARIERCLGVVDIHLSQMHMPAK